MEEFIFRFLDGNCRDYTAHKPPYSDLEPISSHIHPHFVIFNAGQKLAKLDPEDILQMRTILGRRLSLYHGDMSPLELIDHLYLKWMAASIPAEWRKKVTSSNPRPPGAAEQDNHSQDGHPPRRQGLRSATRSQGQGSQVSAGQHNGGQQRAIIPFQAPADDDSSSVSDSTIVEDNTAWIDYIHEWQKQGQDAAAPKMWEPDVLDDSRDEQLAAYDNEHARTPPPPGAWDSWKPAWDSRRSKHFTASDRSRFSSNDWAVLKNNVYLVRPEHPQTTF